jgi:hypothetical protein
VLPTIRRRIITSDDEAADRLNQAASGEVRAMGWTHDSGYEPAYDHEGWAASVLEDDGTDTTSTSSDELKPRVIGWRAACNCGWRGLVVYPCSEGPDKQRGGPDEVEGRESDAGCFKEWEAHLAVYEITQKIQQAQSELEAAVMKARAAGASWTTIGRVAGMTRQSAYEQWAGSERSARS